MSLSAEQLRGRAELAAKRRHHGDAAELSDQAAAVEQAALDRRIDELVAVAPRMTTAQRNRLALLLSAGSGDAA